MIFMGTSEFSVPSLDQLIIDGHEVAAVFTQPDKPAGRGQHMHPPPIKTFAATHGIPVYQPSKIKNNDEARAVFESVSADACIVVAYGKILPAWMLAIPRHGCINVHASLLPKYRGAAPINWAIANGEVVTGVTIMQMDAGMDTGPMLSKRSIAIGPNETAPELSARLSQVGAELLSETLSRISSGEATPLPQDDSQASYAPMLKREMGLIDWNLTANEIANRVRGFQPWPGTHTSFRGGRLIIWQSRELRDDRLRNPVRLNAEPGTILSIDKSGIAIECGASSVLLVQQAQIEGKRRLSARELANGARLQVGQRL